MMRTPAPAPMEHGLALDLVVAMVLGILVVMLVHVPFALVVLVTGEQLDATLRDLEILATFGAIVVVGIISGVAAATIAGSHYPRRRPGAAMMFLLVTAAVGVTLVLLDMAFGADLDENRMLVPATFIVTGVSVLLGTLLGYIVGRERRLAREGSTPAGSL